MQIKGVRDGLPKIVLVHGYLNGGMCFVRLIPLLREHFDVVTVDLLGMAQSGRPENADFSDFDVTLDFFLDAIHKWSQVTDFFTEPGERFVLVGHSMGGLLSSFYTLRHPE